jgi:hypothetical protein
MEDDNYQELRTERGKLQDELEKTEKEMEREESTDLATMKESEAQALMDSSAKRYYRVLALRFAIQTADSMLAAAAAPTTGPVAPPAVPSHWKCRLCKALVKGAIFSLAGAALAGGAAALVILAPPIIAAIAPLTTGAAALVNLVLKNVGSKIQTKWKGLTALGLIKKIARKICKKIPKSKCK